MKKSEWNEGLCNVDTDLVEKYVKQKDELRKKKKQRRVLLRIAALAACIAVIVSAIVVLPMLKIDDLPDVPTWDTAKYSADEIAKLFNSMAYEGVATNAYTKVYVPSSEYLYIDVIPDDEYFNLYQYVNKEQELNEEELKSFVDAFLPKLSESLGASVPEYSIEKKGSTKNSLSVTAEVGSYRMTVSHNGKRTSLVLGNLGDDGQIVIDKETIQFDHRFSDEEILESVQSIKNKLFEILGVSFSDVKISRGFSGYTEDGEGNTCIYFYDESAHPLNSLRSTPISDYICIDCSTGNGHSSTFVSYVKKRIDVNDTYTVVSKAKRISLSDAEALLYNGYVFGGHSCRLCMEAQDKISFEGYDFVDIEYVFGHDNKTGDPTIVMPFYTFYKNIGTAKNGNTIYAKTYVAAIEVSGYDEYFEKQKDNHKNNPLVDEIG